MSGETNVRGAPRVTIGIPTYNRAGLLREAVDSVLAQTVDDWELFVFDDGSSDDTPAVMAGYDDDRITYVRNPVNLGHPRNVSRCLHAGQAPFVALLFDDDVLFPDHLQRVCGLLEAYPRAAVAHSAYELWGTDGVARPVVLDDAVTPFEESGRAFIRRAVRRPPGIWVATAVMRRRCVQDLQFRHEDEPATDLMFWLRVARTGSVVYDPVPTACYRVTEGYSSERDFMAIENGVYQPTFGSVAAYQHVFRRFRAEQALPRRERLVLRLLETRNVHGLLQAVVRRRWYREATFADRVGLLLEAFALDPTVAADPLAWAKVAADVLRPGGRGPTAPGSGAGRPVIDLTVAGPERPDEPATPAVHDGEPLGAGPGARSG